MPPVLAALFFLVGAGAGSALWGPPRAWDRVDPTDRSGGSVSPSGPHTTVSVQSYQVATTDAYGREACRAVVFAVTGGGRRTRAQVGGVELAVDSSWSVDVEAAPNTRLEVSVRYLDPVGGSQLACHVVGFTCVGDRTWTGAAERTVALGEPCE